MSAENPISPKAIASTTGSGLGAVVGGLVTWILGVVVWGESAAAANVTDAIAAVPGPVSAAIVLVIPVGLAGIFGWRVADPNRVTTQELQILRNVQKVV
jgi:hypothetical protein